MKKIIIFMFGIFFNMVGTKALAFDVPNADGILISYEFINDTEVVVIQKNLYSGVVNIPEEVFYMSRHLKVTRIGDSAFYGCVNLNSVTIPNSVTSIGRAAFLSCHSLTSIKIPNSVTSIGRNAFLDCISLTSVSIPSSVTSIEGNIFGYCSNLEFINVELENSKYDSRDNSNSIIETETNILISGCLNTKIPNSVTSIGDWAFAYSGLTSITIPNSVKTIGEYNQEIMGKTNVEIIPVIA